MKVLRDYGMEDMCWQDLYFKVYISDAREASQVKYLQKKLKDFLRGILYVHSALVHYRVRNLTA